MFRSRRNTSCPATSTPPSTTRSYWSSLSSRPTHGEAAASSSSPQRSRLFSRSRLRRYRSRARTPTNTSLSASDTEQTGTDWTYALTLTAAGIATALFTGYTLHHCATNFSETLGRDPVVGGALMLARPAWSVARWGAGTFGSLANKAGRSVWSVDTGD